MGYQFTIGLTPSKTRLTHGSTRITTSGTDRAAPTERHTRNFFSNEFVQDGECATLRGPFLRARDQYNYVTLTKENRSTHRRTTRRRILARRQRSARCDACFFFFFSLFTVRARARESRITDTDIWCDTMCRRRRCRADYSSRRNPGAFFRNSLSIPLDSYPLLRARDKKRVNARE